MNRAEGQPLEDYLDGCVFAGQSGTVLEPDHADVEGLGGVAWKLRNL